MDWIIGLKTLSAYLRQSTRIITQNLNSRSISINLKRLSCLHHYGIAPRLAVHGIEKTAGSAGLEESPKMNASVSSAKKHLSPLVRMESTARNHVITKTTGITQEQKKGYAAIVGSFIKVIAIGRRSTVPVSVQTGQSQESVKVFNLTLERHNAYYANGVLVANCADALTLFLHACRLGTPELQPKSKDTKVAVEETGSWRGRAKDGDAMPMRDDGGWGVPTLEQMEKDYAKRQGMGEDSQQSAQADWSQLGGW